MHSSAWTRLTSSVRVRTTVAATLVVAIALSIGSALLVVRFRQSLDNNRRNAAVARAADIASLASSGRLPAVLGLPNEDATYAQVIDAQGRVVAESANISGQAALAPPLPFGAATVTSRLAQSPADGPDSSMAVRLSAGTAGQPLTVLTGYSLAANDFAVRDIQLALVVGLPVLLLVVGGTAWVIIGRALRPIDAIRTEASQITTDDLHRRLPEPRSDDEVARLVRTMNEMLARLEYSIEREKLFVADASHELRSPLASLRAQLEVGLAGGESTDWQATATDALAEEQRIEQLVKDLLLLARLDRQRRSGGEASAPPAVVVPADLTEVARAEIAARAVRGGPAVTARLAGPAPVLMVPELIRRVVANLVDNAQRHAQAEVVVEVTTGPGRAVLEVRDDGPGVAEADRVRVFERFTRLDAARANDDGGAGLGLAIVRDVVTGHGGTVGFADSLRGARVVVTLPLAPVEDPAAEGRFRMA